MTLKKPKRRDVKAEIRAWMSKGNKGTVVQIADALGMPNWTVNSALLRMEESGDVLRKRAAVQSYDRTGRPTPHRSDLWMGPDDDEADDVRRGNLGIVQSAIAAMPRELPRWLGGRGA